MLPNAVRLGLITRQNAVLGRQQIFEHVSLDVESTHTVPSTEFGAERFTFRTTQHRIRNRYG
ncbi:hypothetical protein GCM10007304_10620 [Rhodococcoides trifolii]|uniref:Uncharacterized protein n=1 Tax=Rhodococcoides trifolii TaxID=908250 RepID=A0A917CU70_9NOCA|nr:hypothetical protein GCM10007304_10620 [Rhodococcus trifolii]